MNLGKTPFTLQQGTYKSDGCGPWFIFFGEHIDAFFLSDESVLELKIMYCFHFKWRFKRFQINWDARLYNQGCQRGLKALTYGHTDAQKTLGHTLCLIWCEILLTNDQLLNIAKIY